MRYTTTDLTEFNRIKVGQTAKEGRRRVKCKSIGKGEDGKMYAHWQYILAKTGKPSGKATSFLKLID